MNTETIKPFDSAPDTTKHIERVKTLVNEAASNLIRRGEVHDASKLTSPEKEAFDKLGDGLRGVTYGSEEYKARLREIKPAIEQHYASNRHHPEYWAAKYDPIDGSFDKIEKAELENGEAVGRMSLLDLLEMLCDWKAAGERHADGSITKSIEHNRVRFGLTWQLVSILENTAREMGWTE